MNKKLQNYLEKHQINLDNDISDENIMDLITIVKLEQDNLLDIKNYKPNYQKVFQLIKDRFIIISNNDVEDEIERSKIEKEFLSSMSDEEKQKLENNNNKSIPDGWMDWNTLSLDQMANILEQKYMFSSSGEALCIHKLIEFYRNKKNE